MALHLHEGQMFRDKDGDTYALQFRPDSTLRLAPVVFPNPNPLVVPFYVDAVEFADEVEAGIWVPFDPESTFVGLRLTSFEKVCADFLHRCDILAWCESVTHYVHAAEKEVSHV